MCPINKGMMSSNKDDWETPQDLYDALDKVFQFDLDPCASRSNHLAPRYFTKKGDGLSKKWLGRVFMNPPYGGVIGDWIKKGYDSVRSGDAEVVVMLIPSRTDTKYWHNYVMNADIIYFVKGRIAFSSPDQDKTSKIDPAPFPSAIIVFFDVGNDGDHPLIGTWDLKEMGSI